LGAAFFAGVLAKAESSAANSGCCEVSPSQIRGP
jgi:hypothetical protein